MNHNPIDPHLRAALRHAPDVDLAPPVALDQRIKAAARQALQPSDQTSPDGPRWPRWRTWLDHLLKPPAAAALATLALGTVIGVMWQGQVPPDAMPGAPSASADLPALAGRPEPQASASVRPQASEPVRSAAPPPIPPQATPKAGTPATVRAPGAVAQAVAPTEPSYAARVALEAAVPATIAQPALPAPPAPKAVEPAGRAAEAEVAALVSPPLPPSPPATPAAPTAAAATAPPLAAPDSLLGATAPVVAAAPAIPTAPAVAGTKIAGESRAAADMARSLGPAAAAAAPRLSPQPSPASAELAAAAAGPWQRVPAKQMPEGGKLVRDAQGNVLGRMLVEPDWLWWQPWADGQAAPLALRAPARRAASAP